MFTSLQTRLKRASRWLPVALLLPLSFAARAQAPANDDPSGAITLPLGTTCTPVNATNTGATTTAATGLGYTNPGCGVAVNPKDVWFTFTTNATGQGSTAVTVTVSGTVAGQVRVFRSTSGAAGPFTSVGCSAGTTNNTQAGPLDLRGLTPNTTYYVFVSGYGSGDVMGAFTICASQLTLANNDAAVTAIYTLGKVSSAFGSPVTAQAVISNPGLNAQANLAVTLTVSGATTYTNTQTIASLASGASTTLSFSFPVTATSGTNTVTVTVPTDDQVSNNSQSVTQTVSANDMSYIFGTTFVGGAGVGSAGSVLLDKYTATGPAAVTTVTPTFSGAGTAGSTYQIVVYSATAGGLPSTLLYTSAARPRPTLAAGVNSADPVAVPSISVGTTYFVGVKTVGADNIGIAYQTEAPLRSGTFFYSADNGATFVDINTSTLNSRLAIDVTLGAPAACGVATGLTATAVTTTGATISFTAPSGATSYTVTYTPAGGTATTVTPAPTASPITLTGLTPGTAYTVNITTNCAAGQTSAVATVTFTTLVPAPANDNCATASALTVTAACTPVNSTNTNSTASPATVPAATCGTAGPDVWYAITVPANGAVTVTTSASSVTTNQLTDTILQLYSGTCGALTPIGCNDDISGSDFYSTASVTGLTAGSTIYARVFGYSNATGDFAICATSPSCLPVSNVAVNNVTTTGAIISFTAPSGATSYTVTYTPAGGATTTVTPAPTASPITLTGLTAATSYTVTIATNCGTSAATAVTTTFRTLGTTYCVTGLGGSCNATTNITAVAITGTTLNATGLTCTSGGTPAQAYTSYPATGANTALLNVGTTYPITVTTATGNSVTVWVDYNRNQNYEPGEFVLLTANSTSTTVTGSIVVPANASLGTTGLRIRTRLSGNPNGPGDACTSFGSGETKDFTVTLRNGTSTRNDALAATVGLFPNPAHQNFQLTVPAGSLHAATATLRNTLGQVVQSRQLNLPVSGGTAEFNVSSLAAGVYTLTLKSGNDFIVKRVVVE